MVDYEYKNLAHDTQLVDTSVWNLAIPVDPASFQEGLGVNDYLCNQAIIGGKACVLLFTDPNGFIYYYKNKQHLLNNCGGKLHSHMSSIAAVGLTYMQDLLLTVGKSDQTLIEWKIKYVDDQNEFKVINEEIENQKVDFTPAKL